MFFHSCWWSFFFGPEENSSSIRLKNPFKSKRVEWLEVVILQFLFLIFKIGHIAVDQMYFQKFIAKKSAIFASRPAHARQSFHIQKFTGALKINIFLRFANTFILLQRTIAKKKIRNQVLFNIFLDPPKLEKLILPMVKAKHFFLLLSRQLQKVIFWNQGPTTIWNK